MSKTLSQNNLNFETEKECAEQFWADNINPEIWNFCLRNSTTSVRSRLENCYLHFTKALIIKDLDPEMSAMRLIAAEEELAVAVFDIIKRNEDHFIDCKRITKKFKNHFVKQLFSPTVYHMKNIIFPFFKNGLSLEVAEELPDIGAEIKPIIKDSTIKLRLILSPTNHIEISPFQFFITGRNDTENITDELCEEFKKLLKHSGYETVKAFAKQRAEFRNKLLYADDKMVYSMGDDIKDIIQIITQTIDSMLLVIALFLSDDEYREKKWGIITQFLYLYERVLIEAKVLSATAE